MTTVSKSSSNLKGQVASLCQGIRQPASQVLKEGLINECSTPRYPPQSFRGPACAVAKRATHWHRALHACRVLRAQGVAGVTRGTPIDARLTDHAVRLSGAAAGVAWKPKRFSTRCPITRLTPLNEPDESLPVPPQRSGRTRCRRRRAALRQIRRGRPHGISTPACAL